MQRGLHDKKCVMRTGIYDTVVDLELEIEHAYEVVWKEELDRELLQYANICWASTS